jgi:hypothetical protein
MARADFLPDWRQNKPSKYRVRRHGDNGNVFSVSGWYEQFTDALEAKQLFDTLPHKQMYWIEDEEGRVVSEDPVQRRKERHTPLFIHHLAVSSENVKKFRQVLAAYTAEHPDSITNHGVGFLGHNYLVYAIEDISKVFRDAGILCRVNEF